MSLSLLGQYGSGSESEISDSDDEQFLDRTGSTRSAGLTGDQSGTQEEVVEVGSKLESSSHSRCQLPGVSASGEAKEIDLTNARTADCSHPLDHGDSKSDSGSDSEDHSGGTPQPPEAEGSPADPLPLPDLDGLLKGSAQGRSLPGSVFSNPYKEAEKAKMAILTRHVDFDQPHLERMPENRTGKPRGSYAYRPRGAHEIETTPVRPGDEFFDDSDSSVARTATKRKHRGGVGNSLVPSKKVVKHHHRLQIKERPWTVQK